MGKYVIEGSASTSTWAGCGRRVHHEWSGITLEEALDSVYDDCKYDSHDKRNALDVFAYSNSDDVSIYYHLPSCDGCGKVSVIRYIDDESKSYIIYEYEKYIGSKCKNVLINYRKKLQDITNRNSVRGDF